MTNSIVGGEEECTDCSLRCVGLLTTTNSLTHSYIHYILITSHHITSHHTPSHLSCSAPYLLHPLCYTHSSQVNQNSYIAYHIRRGDFQQKHTRLAADEIVRLTLPLIPGNASNWLVYIATDEKNISFFAPFFRTFGAVRFLSDYMNDRNGNGNETTQGQNNPPQEGTTTQQEKKDVPGQGLGQGFFLQDMNPNHLGMVEQLVCANAHTFIGTPLSTFTGFITRMRGFMNRTTIAGLPPQPPLSLSPSLPSVVSVSVDVNQVNDQGHNKEKNKNNNKDKDKDKGSTVDPPANTGAPLMRILQQQQPQVTKIGKLVSIDPSLTSPLTSEVGVGLYDRTFYFMKKFTYQLQNKPHLELPFWVREFSEPFEDTEDEEDEYDGDNE